MSRKREPLWPVIAVGIEHLARALAIDAREIRDAIRDDLLPCYRHGTHKRILVSDAIEWIKNTWEKPK